MSRAFYIPDFKIIGIGYNALNKSRDDLHHIYQDLGFSPLYDKEIILNDEKVKYFASNTKTLGDYVTQILNLIENKCQKGDYLFMDFPFSIKFAGYAKIVSYAKAQGVKVICFIHDLDGVRFQNPLMNMFDSSSLDMAYSLISASDNMNIVLKETFKLSKSVKIVNYEYWDYLVPDFNNHLNDSLICFAGNLQKSSFLSKIPKELLVYGFNLYGKGLQKNYLGRFMGEYDPETLVTVLDGKFGLVWDGKTSDTCSGNFGKYLRINTSHKFGLYVASSKPVIVWTESPLSQIVEKYKIGFAVSSLKEILPTLSNMNLETYMDYRKNISELKKEVITGNHLKKVIAKAMQ